MTFFKSLQLDGRQLGGRQNNAAPKTHTRDLQVWLEPVFFLTGYADEEDQRNHQREAEQETGSGNKGRNGILSPGQLALRLRHYVVFKVCLHLQCLLCRVASATDNRSLDWSYFLCAQMRPSNATCMKIYLCSSKCHLNLGPRGEIYPPGVKLSPGVRRAFAHPSAVEYLHPLSVTKMPSAFSAIRKCFFSVS
jgi:hypothetical protein